MVVEVVEEAEEMITTEEGTDTGALLVHTIVADHRLQDQDTDTEQDPEATLLVVITELRVGMFSNIQIIFCKIFSLLTTTTIAVF